MPNTINLFPGDEMTLPDGTIVRCYRSPWPFTKTPSVQRDAKDAHESMSPEMKAQIASYIADIIERRIVEAPPLNPAALAIALRNEAREQYDNYTRYR